MTSKRIQDSLSVEWRTVCSHHGQVKFRLVTTVPLVNMAEVTFTNDAPIQKGPNNQIGNFNNQIVRFVSNNVSVKHPCATGLVKSFDASKSKLNWGYVPAFFATQDVAVNRLLKLPQDTLRLLEIFCVV